MRARGWHMVLISTGVYRGSSSTEHNLTNSQHPAPLNITYITSQICHRKKRHVYFPLFSFTFFSNETLKSCLLNWVLHLFERYVLEDFLLHRSIGINENEKGEPGGPCQVLIWISVKTNIEKIRNHKTILTRDFQTVSTCLWTRRAQLPSNNTFCATVEAATSGSSWRHLLGSN